MDTFGFIFAFPGSAHHHISSQHLTSVLFYLGIIQKLVKAFGWLLSKLLTISGAESLSVAGNVFSWARPKRLLLIKAYLEKMNKSEMLLVMIGGMATVAGAVLAAYIGFLGGDDPDLTIVICQTPIGGLCYGCSRGHCYFENISILKPKKSIRTVECFCLKKLAPIFWTLSLTGPQKV